LQEEAKEALSWTKKLVSETGTRLTGTLGCKKAYEIIYQKLKGVCHSVNKQNFIHHRDAFLSITKLMSVSYIIALTSLWFGGFWNYLAAIVMLFISMATIFEFIFYKEFLDVFFKQTESRNIIGKIQPKEEINQTLIFSAHYDSPYVFHYLQNFQKHYILIITITLLFYLLGVFLSIIAAGYQIQSSAPFVYGMPWIVAMAMGLVFIIPYYFFITDEVSPGAGDNLIAVAVLLQLAKHFKDKENTLDNTELIFLITDAEESGLRGARAFVKKYLNDIISRPHFNYNMDSLFSVDHLTFLTTDINGTVKLSNKLTKKSIELAESLGYSACKMNIPFGGGGTDAGEFAKAGIESVSLIAMDTTFKSGSNPYHTRDDHTENIDSEAVLACLQIAHGFACDIDLHQSKIL